MKKRSILIGVLGLLMVFFSAAAGLCLSGAEVIALKQAGLSDTLIELIMKEKVVETCAFTVQEIIDMKRAGLKENTIALVIREGSFMKDTAPVVYGRTLNPIKLATVGDIIELRKAGLSDEAIQAIIRLGADSVDDAEQQKAWEMLKGMGIVIDGRKGGEHP